MNKANICSGHNIGLKSSYINESIYARTDIYIYIYAPIFFGDIFLYHV